MQLHAAGADLVTRNADLAVNIARMGGRGGETRVLGVDSGVADLRTGDVETAAVGGMPEPLHVVSDAVGVLPEAMNAETEDIGANLFDTIEAERVFQEFAQKISLEQNSSNGAGFANQVCTAVNTTGFVNPADTVGFSNHGFGWDNSRLGPSMRGLQIENNDQHRQMSSTMQYGQVQIHNRYRQMQTNNQDWQTSNNGQTHQGSSNNESCQPSSSNQVWQSSDNDQGWQIQRDSRVQDNTQVQGKAQDCQAHNHIHGAFQIQADSQDAGMEKLKQQVEKLEREQSKGVRQQANLREILSKFQKRLEALNKEAGRLRHENRDMNIMIAEHNTHTANLNQSLEEVKKDNKDLRIANEHQLVSINQLRMERDEFKQQLWGTERERDEANGLDRTLFEED